MGGINEKSLGLSIQKARRMAGFTQQELCQKSGLSYSTLAKIERGAIKSPSIFTIQQIAKVLNLSIDELMGSLDVLDNKPKKSKSGVSFIYFDINGCLVRFYSNAFQKIADDFNLSLENVETACWNYNNEVCRGDITLEEYNAKLAEAFGVDNFDWVDYYLDSVDPITETRELISWASKDFEVGLLSNIMPGLIDHMLARDLLPNIKYSSIIDSSKTGFLKPEPQIYKIAAEKAGVGVDQILLVDDTRANLISAAEAGWRTAWFDSLQVENSCDNVRKILEV